MPKEKTKDNLLRIRQLLRDAQDEIEEALLDYENEDETDNDTGYGFVGSDGIERVSDEENLEADEDVDQYDYLQ